MWNSMQSICRTFDGITSSREEGPWRIVHALRKMDAVKSTNSCKDTVVILIPCACVLLTFPSTLLIPPATVLFCPDRRLFPFCALTTSDLFVRQPHLRRRSRERPQGGLQDDTVLARSWVCGDLRRYRRVREAALLSLLLLLSVVVVVVLLLLLLLLQYRYYRPFVVLILTRWSVRSLYPGLRPKNRKPVEKLGAPRRVFVFVPICQVIHVDVPFIASRALLFFRLAQLALLARSQLRSTR